MLARGYSSGHGTSCDLPVLMSFTPEVPLPLTQTATTASMQRFTLNILVFTQFLLNDIDRLTGPVVHTIVSIGYVLGIEYVDTHSIIVI